MEILKNFKMSHLLDSLRLDSLNPGAFPQIPRDLLTDRSRDDEIIAKNTKMACFDACGSDGKRYYSSFRFKSYK
jgi:hypothetical protein